MTCIVGYVEAGTVFIGGDSAGVSDWDLTIRKDPKVFRNGPFLIGITSSYRMGQLLRFRLSVEQQHLHMDDFEYMATIFIDAVRDCLNAHGWMGKDEDRDAGGSFLVGYRGALYHIENDFQVGISARPYHAVGCGAAYALGALHAWNVGVPGASHPTGADPVRLALETSAALSVGVCGPFIVEELP